MKLDPTCFQLYTGAPDHTSSEDDEIRGRHYTGSVAFVKFFAGESRLGPFNNSASTISTSSMPILPGLGT